MSAQDQSERTPKRGRNLAAWARALLLGLAMVLLWPHAPARAQPIPNVDSVAPVDTNPNPRRDGVVRVLRVDLGLDNALAPERHGPITVWITSGAKPWSGVLAARFVTTNGTRVENVALAATTPGRVTPVEIILRAPSGLSKLDIAANGRTIAELTQLPVGRELPLTVLGAGTAVVGTLGDVSLFRQSRDRLGLTLESVDAAKDGATDWAWSNTSVQGIRRVPQAWIAYGQCEAVVATSSALELLGERGREPLMDWVRTGGHLIVVSDSSSREWTLAGCADAMEMDDVATVPAPQALCDVAAAARPSPAYELRTRPVRVRDATWRPIWPIGADASGAERSLGAQGPVGLGFVTVFGGDPGRWTPTTSRNASILIWREILLTEAMNAADTTQYAWNGGVVGRGGAESRRWLLDSAFSATLPHPGVMASAIMVLVIGLAIAIGPFDMIILRRLKLRHRAHRTAFAWLAGASLVAYIAPLAIRSSKDALARGSVVDVVLAPDGSAVEGVTGCTLVYAGSGAQVEFDGIPEGSWCDHASIESNYYYSDSPSMAVPPLVIAQSSTDAGVRQGMPGVLGVGQWTFRVIEDVQPATRGSARFKSVRVERVGEEWRVSIDGLRGDDTVVNTCLLEINGQALGVALEPQGPGRWSGLASLPPAVGGASVPEVADGVPGASPWYRVFLPMARHRTRTLSAYAYAPGWSVVTLITRRSASDVTWVGSEQRSGNDARFGVTHEVLRIAVPTPDARRLDSNPMRDEPLASSPSGPPTSATADEREPE